MESDIPKIERPTKISVSTMIKISEKLNINVYFWYFLLNTINLAIFGYLLVRSNLSIKTSP